MTRSPRSFPASPKLSLFGSASLGVASMLGAGVFVVWGPAAKLAGNLILVAVVLAGAVAALNARSIRQLAAADDSAGGAYAYGRRFLSPAWGFLAGIGFILGKIGSIASIALTAANYLFPEQKILVAASALAVMTLINILGINRTAFGALVLSSISVSFVIALIIAGLSFAPEATEPLAAPENLMDVMVAASLIFFAFAGYARVATLGREVREPKRTVPKAIALALLFVLLLYGLLGLALVRVLGGNLTLSAAPLLDAASLALPPLPAGAVVLIAASASLGSLLALLAGISRTAAAMAADGELPKVISLRNKRFNAPWVAQLLIGLFGIGLVLSGDLVWTIGISSFCVLTYYLVGNLAAFAQAPMGSWPTKTLSLLGAALCAVIGLMAPWPSAPISAGILAVAFLVRSGLRAGHPLS